MVAHTAMMNKRILEQTEMKIVNPAEVKTNRNYRKYE